MSRSDIRCQRSEQHRGILLEIDPANGKPLVTRPSGRFGRPNTAVSRTRQE